MRESGDVTTLHGSECGTVKAASHGSRVAPRGSRRASVRRERASALRSTVLLRAADGETAGGRNQVLLKENATMSETAVFVCESKRRQSLITFVPQQYSFLLFSFM